MLAAALTLLSWLSWVVVLASYAYSVSSSVISHTHINASVSGSAQAVISPTHAPGVPFQRSTTMCVWLLSIDVSREVATGSCELCEDMLL